MEHPLAQYRKKTGVSREALAKRAGTSRQTIHRIEQGLQSPSLELVARLIAATDKQVKAADFLPPNPPAQGVAA